MGQGAERKTSPALADLPSASGSGSKVINRNSLVVQINDETATDAQSQASPRSSTSVTFNTVPG